MTMFHFSRLHHIAPTLGVLILAWALMPSFAWAQASSLARPTTQPAVQEHLKTPDNLQEIARAAAAEGRALLVLFSEPGCPWCERVRREFLLPMQRNAGYRAKLVFLQLDSTSATPGTANASHRLRDFSGREVTHAEIFKRYGVRLTPTVMLLGPGGETLAEPLAGFTGSDFYGAHLDERIETAVAKIKSRARGG